MKKILFLLSSFGLTTLPTTLTISGCCHRNPNNSINIDITDNNLSLYLEEEKNNSYY